MVRADPRQPREYHMPRDYNGVLLKSNSKFRSLHIGTHVGSFCTADVYSNVYVYIFLTLEKNGMIIRSVLY